MKKLLLIGALVLIAAAAFAQDAPPPSMAFSGQLSTGAIVQSVNSVPPTMGIWDSVNQTKSRFNFQGVFNGTGFGLYFRLREDDNWNQGNTNAKVTSSLGTDKVSIPAAPGFRRLYGYIDAAGGMVRIAGGRLAGYEWATGDAGGANTLGNLDGAVGLQLQLKPLDGLNFGVFVPFTYGNSDLVVPNLDALKALNFIAFGAKYTMKGLGDIEGGYWLAPDLGASTQATNSSNFYSYPKAWFGAAYTGMPNLTAVLETQIANSVIGDLNYGYLAETVKYQMDQLGVALYAEQLINASSTFGTYLGFRPTVDYTMGMVNVGAFAEILYVTSDTYRVTGAKYNGHLGYSGGPFVKLTFAKNVYIRLTGEVGGGDVTPPSPGASFVSFPGNISSPYQEGSGWSPLAGTFWQTHLNFVVSF